MTLSRRALIAGLSAIPFTRLSAAPVAHRIGLIHLNDFHARHDPVDARALNCTTGEACFGGSPRLATAIAVARERIAADGRTPLLLDAGDQFQGSLFYTAWHGDVELAVMHALGTEAMAVGNHEFDNGPANLARFVRAARFPVLSANIDASDDPDLRGLIEPWTILGKAGLAVGIVGATTPETLVGSSPGPHIRIGEPAPALAAAAAAARSNGARFVIALSHLGVAADRALAGQVAGIDLIVGGHSHTLLSDTEPGAAGPAHAVYTGPAGRCLVLQAGCFGRYLGRLDLDVAEDGTLVAFSGDVTHVGLDLPEEPAVRAIVAGYAAQLDAVRRRPVGTAAAAIGNEGCRIGECALGDLVADAMLASTHRAEIALMNGGGLRTGLPGGTLTLGDVLVALPYGNTLATLTLTGADVRAALANGLGKVGRGAFPQVAGLRVVWRPDPADPVVSIDVRQPDGAYAPLDPARRYLVVTNDFMRQGGDGYTVLKTAAIDPYDAGPGLDTVVADALLRGSPVTGKTDGRLTRQ